MKGEYGNYERSENTISIYVVYLNGTLAEQEGTLGIADSPYTIVIFQRMIREISTRTHFERKYIELATLNHEFGHLLSLVGKGYESEHEDSLFPGHCDGVQENASWLVLCILRKRWMKNPRFGIL